jgi:hypothetical protein
VEEVLLGERVLAGDVRSGIILDARLGAGHRAGTGIVGRVSEWGFWCGPDRPWVWSGIGGAHPGCS